MQLVRAHRHCHRCQKQPCRTFWMWKAGYSGMPIASLSICAVTGLYLESAARQSKLQAMLHFLAQELQCRGSS